MFEEGYKLFAIRRIQQMIKNVKDEIFSLSNACTTTKKDRNLRIYN
jgi:hypothetical protein